MGIEEENEGNACCQKWKQKLVKSENGRKMLRQGIRILEDGIQKAREEIEALKTERENEQKQAEDESKKVQEERRLRLELENEHNSLKMELTSVLKRLSDIESTNKIEDKEMEHVESKKVNVNEEKRLTDLLEKERQATEFERKKSEEMKRLVNTEKKKVEKEKKRADAAKKKAEEEKKCADAAKKKAEEEKKHVDAVQKKAEEEKKHADAAKKKAEEERKCAEIERKKFEEEKKRADAERKRAEDEKMNREMLEKKLQQAELERQRAIEGRKHDEAKENLDRKKSEEEKKLKEQLKKERQHLKDERRRAEEEKSQRETLEKEHLVLKEQLEKEHQQLEAELKRAEEAKTQRAILEREQSVLKEELVCVTQCLKVQEGQLNDAKREVERLQIEVRAVDGSCMCKRNLPRDKIHYETAARKPSRRARVVIPNNAQGKFGFNNSSLAKESPSGPSESEGFNPGISCLLEPSIGGSVEKQVQTSVLHSTITSFSDRQLVESQGGVAVISSDSSKMRKHKKSRGLEAPIGSPATAEQVCSQVLALPEGPRIHKGVIDFNEKRSILSKQGNYLKKSQKCTGKILTHKQTNEALKKRNGPKSLVDSIARLFNKEKKAVLMIEEKIIALREALRVEQATPGDGLSPKLSENKLNRKRKRDTARNLSKEPNFVEVMELKDQKAHQSKPEQSTKEDWSVNCPRVHVPNQDNESQEDESHVKLQTGSKEMPEFVRSRTSCDLVEKRGDEGASNLDEVALNEQATTEFLFDFDIKKMLQLDNESDEELYMQATESLLSPTMPEMSDIDLEDLACENLDTFLEETSYNEIELLTGKNYNTDVLETMKGVSSQLVDAKKPFELDKDTDEEYYFQDKQILLSPTLPKRYEVLKQLKGNCCNLSSQHGPSQVIDPFTSRGCDTGVLKNDTSQKFHRTAGISGNSLLLHSVGEDDKVGNLDEENCCNSSGMEMDENAVQPNLYTQTRLSGGINCENHCSEIDSLIANEVLHCNIEQSKQSVAKFEDDKQRIFSESGLEQVEPAKNKSEHHSSHCIADDGQNMMGSCNDNGLNHSPSITNNLFLAGDLDSESNDLVCEKLTGLEGICGHLYQSSGLHISGVSQSNIEQVNGLEMETEVEKQVKEVEITSNVQEQRKFTDFWILSSCFQDDNNSNSTLHKIQHYLDGVLNASSRTLDLERLILNFASNTKLSREDMVCICISAIMSNLTSIEPSSEASGLFSPDHASSLWSRNLITQINKVSSKPETKGTFLNFFAFDIILRLMTNFLIEGKIEVYTASNVKQGCSNLTGRLVEAECGQFFASHRMASFAELRAGSNILASFCLALGHVDCLYEVIYHVLRWCKQDSIWLLTIAHSIAFHCWENSLQVSRSNLLGDTIRCIIILLEGHGKGVSQSLQNNVFLDSVQNQTPPLCVHCPFAEDVRSVDAIVSSLLETLLSAISTYHGEQRPTGVLECPNSAISDKAERKVESQNMHQDATAGVNKLDVPMHENQCQTTVHAHYELSCLNDTVRALELVAQYLGWDWTYNELIPHLWRMAQPNVPEVFIAAIFMLLGNVGRFGVDYDGHEHPGVEELRCNLSTFLDLHCMNNGIQLFPFSSQLAAAQSLYELISINMKTSKFDQTESSLEGAVGGKVHLTHLQILRKWYSNLTAEQQSMFPEYLRADISVLTS